MRTRASLFGLVALLHSGLLASSIAAERDRFEMSSGWSRDRSPAAANDLRAINKLISEINAAEKADAKRMLSIVIINTNVAGETLKKQKSRLGFSLGEVYVAHSLALASRKSFDQIVASKVRGDSWAKIAQMNRVSLQGSTAALKEMMRSKRDD